MYNEVLIRELYEKFAEKDYEGIRAIFDDNIVWTQMKGFPGGGTYIGANDIFKYVFNGLAKQWQEWRVIVTAYISSGDDIIVFGTYEGIFSANSQYIKAPFAHHYKVYNGKITHFTQYTDTYIIAKEMQG